MLGSMLIELFFSAPTRIIITRFSVQRMDTKQIWNHVVKLHNTLTYHKDSTTVISLNNFHGIVYKRMSKDYTFPN